MKQVIDFFKDQNLYNEQYFNQIIRKTSIYDKPYEEIRDFIGCYRILDDNGNIKDFKLILPKIHNINDVLIYIHEYSHALFIEDDSEVFPNIMEAIFICNNILDNKLRSDIVSSTLYRTKITDSENHIIGNKIKLLYLKEKFKN